MKNYGLMPSNITAALAEQNLEASPGTIGEQSDVAYQYTLRYKGRMKTSEEYGNIVLTSNTNGQTLHLKDVAENRTGSAVLRRATEEQRPSCRDGYGAADCRIQRNPVPRT